jgi:hypothetical protein
MAVFVAAAISVVWMAACGDGSNDNRLATDSLNAVYYWRTTLRIDSTERAFLHKQRITKFYCRYFDVVMGDNGEPRPNATITFSDTLPSDIEMVPTVFITEDCMHQPHAGLAEKLVRRILQMNETHHISGVSELQIDCDYTARSRRQYYRFLQETAQVWDSLHSSTSLTHPSLSTTIRLHQLSMPAPPVDYGVLMLYNTGDPRLDNERRAPDGRLAEGSKNPILDLRDVQPYLRYLKGYPLPLAAAYPVYHWVRQVGNVRLDYEVEAAEILRVKRAVEHHRGELRRAIVTYALDNDNIKRYKPHDYEAIYHH